jgi:hypothetical protein
MDRENNIPGDERKVALSEGADVYGSDGKHGGRVEAVGARYLTVAAGSLGQKAFHVPLDFIARADAERVELSMPLVDAQTRAFKDIPPPDEPIYAESEPIQEDVRQATGIPLPARGTFGL